MVKQLIIHIGDRKAGSTSIQHTLAQRGWTCASTSLFYPKNINQTPLSKSLSEPSQYKHRQARFAIIEKQIKKTTADVGVISAENFEDVPPERLKKALETYLPAFVDNIRLIAYVRPHAERIVSSWAQQVKMGRFTGSLEDFHKRALNQKRFQYHSRFCAWRDVFGSQFTLRPMIRNQLYKDSVVQDFFRFALQTKDFTLTEAKSNESISLEDMAMLRIIHKTYLRSHPHAMIQEDIARFLTQLFSNLPKRKVTTKPRLHKAMVPDVIAAYKDDSLALDADFFDGTPMFDALQAAGDKATDTPPSILPENRFEADEIRSIQALAELLAITLDNKGGDLSKYLSSIYRKNARNTAPEQK